MKFDYKVENYDVGELANIFDLPKGYDRSIISMNELKLRNSVMEDGTIDYNVKMQTIGFLNDAKNILLANVDKPTLATAEIEKKQQIMNIPKYTVTHPEEFFPISRNPVKGPQRTINLNIDTRFRQNYYVTQASNYTLVLPMKVQSVVSMSISSLEVPAIVYFSVSQALGNNFIWLNSRDQTLTDVNGVSVSFNSSSTCITLPDGNFSGDDTINLINKYLAAIPTNYPTTGIPPDVNLLQFVRFTVSSNTGSLSGSNGSNLLIAYIELGTTTNPGWTAAAASYGFTDPFNPSYVAPVFTFEIDCQADLAGNRDFFTPLPLKLGWGLGYRNGLYVNNSSYISEGTVNLNGPIYYYLCVDDFNNANDTIYSILTDSILSKNILSRSAIQSSSGIGFSNISYNSTPRTYPGPVDIQRLHIRLIDAYGRNLNIMNMDFSFVLTFTLSAGDGPSG
jgi:hypothetical protein